MSGLLCFFLAGFQAVCARSDGSFPGKGSYTAWINANQFIKFGNDFASHGDMDKALDCYKKAIQTYEFDSIFYFNVGNAFSRKGQLAIAEESYRKAVDLEPDYFQAWLNLGHTDARLGRAQEAVKAFRKASQLSQNPDEKAAIEKYIMQLGEMPSVAPPLPGKDAKKMKPADSAQVLQSPQQEPKKKKVKKKKKQGEDQPNANMDTAGPGLPPAGQGPGFPPTAPAPALPSAEPGADLPPVVPGLPPG